MNNEIGYYPYVADGKDVGNKYISTTSNSGRSGDVTRGKRKGVKFIIKVL